MIINYGEVKGGWKMGQRYGDKITANIYRVAWWDITSTDYVNCDVYAIDCGDSVVLIDSGRGGQTYPQLKENLKYWGLWDRVSVCLLTHLHRDHAGAVMNLRSDGIKVWGGQGHTSTCTTYLASVCQKIYAFTGDLLMPNGTIGYSGSFDFNYDCLLDSLNRLLQHDFEAILTGHFSEKSQPEGFWIDNGKIYALNTYQNGLDGKWNIQKS
jgi:glyoxylase-like metal-dependent hydrolase (beta-lactamase superfamily II)